MRWLTKYDVIRWNKKVTLFFTWEPPLSFLTLAHSASRMCQIVKGKRSYEEKMAMDFFLLLRCTLPSYSFATFFQRHTWPQKECMQFLAPFSITAWSMPSHEVIHFNHIAGSKNHIHIGQWPKYILNEEILHPGQWTQLFRVPPASGWPQPKPVVK